MLKRHMDKASKWIIANGGGLLIVPSGVAVNLEIKNIYQNDRKSGPTVTIIDRRKGYEIRHLPQVGKNSPIGWVGNYQSRKLNMKKSLAHCGGTHVNGYRNTLIKGAISYDQVIEKAVKKGKNVRIDVPSIRGLAPSMYLTLTGKSWSYAAPYDRLRVKTVAYDPKSKRNYITADLKYDHPKGALLYNKNVTGSLSIETSSNCDNQTWGELAVVKRQYAQGDNCNIASMYTYQGDVFSGLGDERGVGIDSQIAQDIDPFYGVVEKVNWKNDAITIKPGICNIHKLATSRPLINMNKKKWITGGKVRIVSPKDWGGEIIKNPAMSAEDIHKNGIEVKKAKFTFVDKNGKTQPSIIDYNNHPVYKFKHVYKGRAYPSIILSYTNKLGGLIEGSADCGWTEDVIGRYFAVASKGEYLYPGDRSLGGTFGGGSLKRPYYRWYKIKTFNKRPDGTCTIKIKRIRWAAVNAGAPKLYNEDNYTSDGHDRPMDYIIAPGAYVYDISDAWEDRKQQGGVTYKADKRTLRVVPKGDRNTAFDFAPGDPIVQAVGPDPAIPVAFRIRMFNHTPGTMEEAGIDIVNSGTVVVDNGISIMSRGINKDAVKKRKDRKPYFNTAININTVTGNAIKFHGDVTNAALMFEQPHDREQPIKWRTKAGSTTLTVNPSTSDMDIKGSALAVKGVKKLQGISGTDKLASNLRGIDVGVKHNSKHICINFNKVEVDGEYSLSVLPSWFTQIKIKSKGAKGFVVDFSTPAPENAKIDWQLIR